jgi:hypothetical protein
VSVVTVVLLPPRDSLVSERTLRYAIVFNRQTPHNRRLLWMSCCRLRFGVGWRSW